MIKLNYKNVSQDVIGAEYGLDIEREFSEFAPKIESIIKDLNLRKDKQGQWLQWMTQIGRAHV